MQEELNLDPIEIRAQVEQTVLEEIEQNKNIKKLLQTWFSLGMKCQDATDTEEYLLHYYYGVACLEWSAQCSGMVTIDTDSLKNHLANTVHSEPEIGEIQLIDLYQAYMTWATMAMEPEKAIWAYEKIQVLSTSSMIQFDCSMLYAQVLTNLGQVEEALKFTTALESFDLERTSRRNMFQAELHFLRGEFSKVGEVLQATQEAVKSQTLPWHAETALEAAWLGAKLQSIGEGSSWPLLKLVERRKPHRRFPFVVTAHLYNYLMGDNQLLTKLPNREACQRLFQEHRFRTKCDEHRYQVLEHLLRYQAEPRTEDLTELLRHARLSGDPEVTLLSLMVIQQEGRQQLKEPTNAILHTQLNRFLLGLGPIQEDSWIKVFQRRRKSKLTKEHFNLGFQLGNVTSLFFKLASSSFYYSMVKSFHPKGSRDYETQKHRRYIEIYQDHLGYMKGSFVKMGQMFEGFLKLLPSDLPEHVNSMITAMGQSSTTAMNFELVEMIIEKDLGRPLKDLFSEFNQEPLAVASVSQVHRARLKTGEEVAVKVKFPNIDKMLKRQGRAFRLLAPLLTGVVSKKQIINLTEHGQVILFQEIDFEHEVQKMQTIGALIAKDPHNVVPKPYVDFCSKNVVVMEFLKGRPASIATRWPDPKERTKLLEQIIRTHFRLVYQHNVLNCDPHVENFLIMEDGRLGFLDFGGYTTLEDGQTEFIKGCLKAIKAEDYPLFLKLLGEAGFLNEHYTPEYDDALCRVGDMLTEWQNKPGPIRFSIERMDQMAEVMQEALPAFKLPPGYIGFIRGDVCIAGILLAMDTEVDIHRLTHEFVDGLAEAIPDLAGAS